MLRWPNVGHAFFAVQEIRIQAKIQSTAGLEPPSTVLYWIGDSSVDWSGIQSVMYVLLFKADSHNKPQDIRIQNTTYETEVKDFFDIDRHVGVLSP